MDKAQVWTVDLIAGIGMFLVVLSIFVIYLNNISDTDTDTIENLYSDSTIVSNMLLSSDLSSEQEVEYRINISKFDQLSNYQQGKLLLNTRFEYLVFFEDRDGSVIDFNGTQFFGLQNVTKDNFDTLNAKNVVSTRRFVIHENEIVTMVLYLWQ